MDPSPDPTDSLNSMVIWSDVGLQKMEKIRLGMWIVLSSGAHPVSSGGSFIYAAPTEDLFEDGWEHPLYLMRYGFYLAS